LTHFGCHGGGVRACLLHHVTAAEPNRVLKILVDPRRSDLDMMGSIGHELQYAIEVLSDPNVTSARSMMAFYRRHGTVLNGLIETRAAIAAGTTVRSELKRHAAAPASASPR
jgi:hypothetical protein